jgi:hypothetical protein
MSHEPHDAPVPPREAEERRQGSTTMPTFADIRRRVRDGATDLLGGKIDEQTLRGCCAVLAALAINPAKLRTRPMRPGGPEGDDLIAHTALYFAEELALLEEACGRLDEEAVARGLRGTARDAWCAARVNTEFIGRPRRRRAGRRLPRGH